MRGLLLKQRGKRKTMSLIIKEIQMAIQECEQNKKIVIREADVIREERKCYEHIKNLMGVITNEENNTVRQDS